MVHYEWTTELEASQGEVTETEMGLEQWGQESRGHINPGQGMGRQDTGGEGGGSPLNRLPKEEGRPHPKIIRR